MFSIKISVLDHLNPDLFQLILLILKGSCLKSLQIILQKYKYYQKFQHHLKTISFFFIQICLIIIIVYIVCMNYNMICEYQSMCQINCFSANFIIEQYNIIVVNLFEDLTITTQRSYSKLSFIKFKSLILSSFQIKLTFYIIKYILYIL